MNQFSKSTTLLCLVLFLFNLNTSGQSTLLNPGYKVYSSPNPKQDSGVTEDDVWKITFADVFTLGIDLSGGINATGNYSTFNWNAQNWQPKVRLTIYAYNDTKANGKGNIIYEAQATQAGNLIAEPTTVYPHTELLNNEAVVALGAFNVLSHGYNSLDIKRLGMNAKFQVPKNLPTVCTTQDVVKTVENTDNKESWFRNSWRWLKWKFHEFVDKYPGGGLRKRRSVSVSPDCKQWIDEHIRKNKIIVEVYLIYPVYAGESTPPIDFSSVKIPLLGVKSKSDFTAEVSNLGATISSVVNPDYDKMVVAAHRGYFKDVPENSTTAITRAIEQDVEIVEIDIRLTKDKKIVLAHDLQLGRLTTIPDRIRNNPPEGGWPKMPGPPSGQDQIKVSDLTLAQIRPDLSGNYSAEPIYLKKADGSITNEIIPTLKEVLRQCKGKIIVDIDKIENFYDLVYQDAKETGTLHQVIVKGRFGNPQDLKDHCCSKGVNNLDGNGNLIIDWTKYMFTPIYFADADPKDENGSPITISQSLNSFITANPSTFNCVGVELIYLTDTDPLISMIQTIKNKNKHVIQFPQYSENSAGVWNPKKFRFNDIDPRNDHRNDWEWVLDPSRRPSMLITDRLEVLLNLLEIKGLRD